jgi:zinc transporter
MPALGHFHLGFVLDGAGSGRAIEAGGARRWTPEQGVLWVVLDRNHPEARTWLTKVAALKPIVVESILANEPRPRCLVQEGGLLVTLRGVNLNPGDQPDDMVAVRGWFDENRAVVLRGRRVFAIEDVADSVGKRAGPTRSGEVLVRLVDALTDRIADTADELSQQADSIETATHLAHVPKNLRTKIGDLRARCMTMRRHIAPQRDMIGRMASEATGLLAESDRARLRENAEQLARVVDELDLVRERLMIAQEQLAARVNERLSRNMYLLSIVAAVFLPLSLVTGLASVSVAGLPGADDPRAFWVLCGLLGATVALEIVLLRKMRWM